jgi:hypothetical protein
MNVILVHTITPTSHGNQTNLYPVSEEQTKNWHMTNNTSLTKVYIAYLKYVYDVCLRKARKNNNLHLHAVNEWLAIEFMALYNVISV